MVGLLFQESDGRPKLAALWTANILFALADFVTEPAMMAQTVLANAFGWLVGTAPGSRMSLQHIFSGLAYLAIIVVACFIPIIRNVEEILPDHDQLEKTDPPDFTPGTQRSEGSVQPAS